MRVVWFFETFPFGGAEKVALDLAHAFQIYTPDICPVIIARKFVSRPDGIECRELDSNEPLRKPGGVMALIEALKAAEADVYIQAMDPPAGLLDKVRRALPGMKLVYHLHNMPYWQVKRKCAGRPIARLREALFSSYTRRYRKRYAADYAAVDCWVTLCRSFTETLRGELGDKVITMYNPLDLDRFLPFRECEKRCEVLSIGRLSKAEKCLDRLLRVWSQVRTVHPSWRLKIVGEGPDEPRLRAIAAKLKLENVEFCGPSDNPAEHYATASVLVQTSSYEGWPLVLVEGMAAGARVLAMECSGGVSEIINRGNACGTAEGDEHAFAAALSEMMAHACGSDSDSLPFLQTLSLKSAATAWQSLFSCGI